MNLACDDDRREFVESIMRQVAEVGFREGYRAAKPDATDDEIDKVWRERHPEVA